MYRHYHSSDWNFWNLFKSLFALILGVVMLISAPIVEQRLRNQERDTLSRTLKYFSQSYDLWEATLPENIEGVEVQRFKHLGHSYYDIKLVTENYYYDGELINGRLQTSIKEAEETHVSGLTKMLITVGVILILLNIVWRVISHHYLFCTLYAAFEDLCWAIKRFFREGVL